MLKFAIILLDDLVPSFCHYSNNKTESYPMPLQVLKDAIFWCMKNNLSIQFMFPSKNISEEYQKIIDSIDHVDICTLQSNYEADIIIVNSEIELREIICKPSKCSNLILRCKYQELPTYLRTLRDCFKIGLRINIVLTNIGELRRNELNNYRNTIHNLYRTLLNSISNNENPSINILTDRLSLSEMANCGAGETSITIAPNGKFYICPAYYLSSTDNDRDVSVGDLYSGLKIPNSQLYKISHAPICRNCDAYHCHRCVWLNEMLTLEVNTPSYQQCIISHIEREGSRILAESLRERFSMNNMPEIVELDYLDPFEITKK